MSAETESRLEALEIKLAYQEQTVAELNEVIVEQRKQLDKLEEVCRMLRERLRAADEPGADPTAHEPPPHY